MIIGFETGHEVAREHHIHIRNKNKTQIVEWLNGESFSRPEVEVDGTWGGYHKGVASGWLSLEA